MGITGNDGVDSHGDLILQDDHIIAVDLFLKESNLLGSNGHVGAGDDQNTVLAAAVFFLFDDDHGTAGGRILVKKHGIGVKVCIFTGLQ